MTERMSIEKEIGTAVTGIALSEDYFKMDPAPGFLPRVMAELEDKCKGIINESGIYEFRLQVIKRK